MASKKKDELTDQLAVYQQRKAPRWGKPQTELKAGITIAGYEGEGQLGNVSTSGCSLMSVTYVNMKPDDVYHVKIIPAKEDKLQPFSMKMRLSWTKSNETFFYAGFSMEGFEGKDQMEKYIDVLRLRGVEPDFGNMDGKF